MKMKLDRCSALITGASAGIGREFARQLAGRARSLILLARREQRLNQLSDELRQQHSNLTVHIRKTDLADLAQLKELMAWLQQEKINVDLLVNNAGLGDLGPFATSDSARNEQMSAYFSRPPFASSNDREHAWRDFECQFGRRFSSDSRIRGLRRDQSVRHKLFRSSARRTPRNRCERLHSLSRACAHGISGSCNSFRRAAQNRTGIRLRYDRTSCP